MNPTLNANYSESPQKIARLLADKVSTADPDGLRFANTFRSTLDQLYDGGRTGRYRWDQLHKTEKTHFGTLIEINIRREFDDIIEDGKIMDFSIDGHEVDCKYSQQEFGWTIPNESVGHHAMLCHADDQNSWWSVGFIYVSNEILTAGRNRDQKRTISAAERCQIVWAWQRAPLPPNVLLHLDPSVTSTILSASTGQRRVNELLREVQGVIIPRGVIETVAQQKDPMKRIRSNGGARTMLLPEGFLVLAEYKFDQWIARALDLPVPGPGELLAQQVVETDSSFKGPRVMLEGKWWRKAEKSDYIGKGPTYDRNNPTPREREYLNSIGVTDNTAHTLKDYKAGP